MKKSLLLILVAVLVSCASVQKSEIVKKELVLPKVEFDQLVAAEQISEQTLLALESKYTAFEQVVPESVYGFDEPFMGNCIVVEEKNEFENVINLRITGAEERWVPIEGKVTKVIHFRMVD